MHCKKKVFHHRRLHHHHQNHDHDHRNHHHHYHMIGYGRKTAA